ncbi:MAG: histone deacetylase [Bacillota bacterium]
MEMIRTGLVYDPVYLQHDTGRHVEQPGRLSRTMAVLEEKGILGGIETLAPRAASVDEVAMVHSLDYIRKVEAFCKAGGGHLDPDTVASPRSFDVALLAVGGALEAVDAVMEGRLDRVLALVRPPGHHALPNRAMGFCLFNNVAVAARYAKQKYKIKRVLIIDWDYHHGNGTEAAFYAEPGVLYFSTHSAAGYPGTGWVERKGEGSGEGFNINVPLPDIAGDEDLKYVFQEVLVPVAAEYAPELILVSAGQDGYRDDPIAGMNLTAAGYGALAAMVREIADRSAEGRIAGVLEGGYDLEGLGECVSAILTAWMQKEEYLKEPAGEVNLQVVAVVTSVKETHQEYWRCFQDGRPDLNGHEDLSS